MGSSFFRTSGEKLVKISENPDMDPPSQVDIPGSLKQPRKGNVRFAMTLKQFFQWGRSGATVVVLRVLASVYSY